MIIIIVYLSTSSTINSFGPLRIILTDFNYFGPWKKMKSLSPTASSYTSSQVPINDSSKVSSPSVLAMVVTTVAFINKKKILFFSFSMRKFWNYKLRENYFYISLNYRIINNTSSRFSNSSHILFRNSSKSNASGIN